MVDTKNISWYDVVQMRNRREDEAVARKWEQYKHYGRGWIGDLPSYSSTDGEDDLTR